MSNNKIPMTVAYTSHFGHLKMGGQTSLVALIENIDRKKINPLAILPFPGDLSRKLESLDCRVYYVPFKFIQRSTLARFSLLEAYQHIPNMLAIRNILTEQHAVILHVDEESDMMICGLAALQGSTRVIWHIRVNGRWRFDSTLCRLASGIIGVSEGAKNRLSERALIKYRTVFDGVDTSFFCPANDKIVARVKLGLPTNRLLIAQIGQIKQGKGVLDMIDALVSMPGLINKVLLLIIGSPVPEEPELPEIIQAKIEAKGLQGSVRLLPQQKNIGEWMRAVDLVSLPSYPGVEGLPRVILESMASGTPCLGTDTLGIRELITPSSGFIVPPHSPESIAQVINELIGSTKKLQIFAKQARLNAVQQFDIKTHAANIESYYMDLLNKRLTPPCV